MNKALLDTIATTNVVTWLEMEALKLGTDDQCERWLHVVLPEEELLQLARAELFKGFGAFTRWHTNDGRRAMRVALRHVLGCRTEDPTGKHRSWKPGESGTQIHDPLRFELADVDELSAGEWHVLKEIQAAAQATNLHPWLDRSGGQALVDTHTHWAECSGCKAEVTRSVAKVSIQWAGRVLVREYLL